MKIKGRLIFKSEEAGELVNNIARSLAPDNVSEIQTFVDGDSATVTFSADKVGTMLSSVDDYLMNAKIAEDMLKKVKRI
ncbi:MAG: KEOPS complex subunit Pcc1 [Candidatus Methanoperedens sp.]|nr:KEOPS complex subunit Pcc1 [Candidatus Methanoperedens sp.]MCZ7397536.1 KEOPS complex subunit Pcc1 [Candidatus Methanoperedens sp.]